MTRTPQRRIEFTVSYELGDAYDRARGDVKMATWIKRALESALSGSPQGATPPDESDPGVTASKRSGKTREGVGASSAAPTRTPVIPDEGQHHKAVMARQAKLNAAKAGKR